MAGKDDKANRVGVVDSARGGHEDDARDISDQMLPEGEQIDDATRAKAKASPFAVWPTPKPRNRPTE